MAKSRRTRRLAARQNTRVPRVPLCFIDRDKTHLHNNKTQRLGVRRTCKLCIVPRIAAAVPVQTGTRACVYPRVYNPFYTRTEIYTRPTAGICRRFYAFSISVSLSPVCLFLRFSLQTRNTRAHRLLDTYVIGIHVKQRERNTKRDEGREDAYCSRFGVSLLCACPYRLVTPLVNSVSHFARSLARSLTS